MHTSSATRHHSAFIEFNKSTVTFVNIRHMSETTSKHLILRIMERILCTEDLFRPDAALCRRYESVRNERQYDRMFTVVYDYLNCMLLYIANAFRCSQMYLR